MDAGLTSDSNRSPANGPHPKLQELRLQLKKIYQSLAVHGPTVPKPPILDSSVDLSGRDAAQGHQDPVPGLQALRDAVRRDMDVLEKFLADDNCASLPPLSTNAPYLIAVWHEVLSAPQPVVAIWKTYDNSDLAQQPHRRGPQKPPGVKVDIVADHGRRWIRVNTVKNSRMLAEFREIDSYMTDSDDDPDDRSEERQPTLAQTIPDNAVLRMGRALVTASQQNIVPGTTEPPHITLRLTRLDPSPSDPKEHDPRIAQTIQELQNMGIDVQLGERDIACLPTASTSQAYGVPSHRLEPTSRINLDLSLLIALVSDITHAPLPGSAKEAEARFVPPPAYQAWKTEQIQATKDSAHAAGADDPGLPDWTDGAGKHSRALAHQAQQEMRRGLLQEIHGRLAAPLEAAAHVEFWTTPEARDRCLRIVLSKIGGPNEQRRVRALFPDPAVDRAGAEEAYWLHSRYPRGFLPLTPIRIFPSSQPDDAEAAWGVGAPPGAFFRQLERTARLLLAQEAVPRAGAPLSQAEEGAGGPARGSRSGGDGDEEEILRASVLRGNGKLTAHTVQSLLWGTHRGWTTLTANKTSVKAILRELRTASWSAGEASEEVAVGKAAVWIVDPRSLAEGMSQRFRN
ncbi:hypothetical protein B0H21DRAFT_852125 [Amylocystis lapponica]|nr:hypothetical protein B0H21DRAFT_852125 [Amylocystis lapponica]